MQLFYVAAQTNYPAYDAGAPGWTRTRQNYKCCRQMPFIRTSTANAFAARPNGQAARAVRGGQSKTWRTHDGTAYRMGRRRKRRHVAFVPTGRQCGSTKAIDTEYTAAWTPGAAVTATAADSAASVYIQQAASANDTQNICYVKKRMQYLYRFRSRTVKRAKNPAQMAGFLLQSAVILRFQPHNRTKRL